MQILNSSFGASIAPPNAEKASHRSAPARGGVTDPRWKWKLAKFLGVTHRPQFAVTQTRVGCIDRGIQAVPVSRRGENHLSGKRHFAILRRWRTPPQASFWLAVSARFHRIAQSN